MLTESAATAMKRYLLQFGFWQNPPHCAHSWRVALRGTGFLVFDIKHAADGYDWSV
jgi:hypothetical protein